MMKDSGQAVCPLCGADVGARDALRVHLMVEHPKSEVTDGLLRAAEPTDVADRPDRHRRDRRPVPSR